MRTVGDWIRLNHRRSPGKEAFVADDGRVTFGEAAERAWGLGRGLRDLGVAPGGAVGVLAGNSLFNAEAFLGIAASGGVYAAYNWRWAVEELASGIRETRAGVILVEERFEEGLAAALALVEADRTFTGPLPRVIRQGEVDALRTGAGPIDEVVAPADPLCLIYTGGSTGTPKAVVLSHGAVSANSINEMISCDLGTAEDDRGLVLTPLFHSAALLCWLTTHFIAGSTSIIAARFDEETLVRWVESERVTDMFLIPNMMRRVMEAGVFASPGFQRHFRAMHTGAGLLRMPDKERFFEVLPHADLFFRYGLTEAGPQVTRLHTRDMLDPAVDGSIGQPYFSVEAEVMRLDDGGAAEPGELGEICVRGPALMTRYYGRPEATAEAMRGGWLRTGDLAVRDERGYFFFRDRLKEMIKSGGENVYSNEVEQVLHLHPAVLEAAVVGVPDLAWDEEVRAVVVFRDGMIASADQLKRHVREHLAGYKVPKAFAFIRADEMPRSAAGKLEKTRLKQNLGWLPN